MFTISKIFKACCAHHLNHVAEGHPCKRNHGHNYVFELILAADNLDEKGFVEDYRALDDFKKWVDRILDHRDLNEVLPATLAMTPDVMKTLMDDGRIPAHLIINPEPTAELLACFIYHLWKVELPFLIGVRVRETDNTCAEYRP